jgi:hypothetical protein
VPIRVRVPPVIVATEREISTLDGLMPRRRDNAAKQNNELLLAADAGGS